MDPQQIEELLPFYALDALTEEERELVEEYLAKHPEARQQVEEMSETAAALPRSVSPVEPRPQIKQALMARVVSDAQARRGARMESQPSRRGIQFENLFRALSLGTALAAILWALVLNLQVSQLRTQIAMLNQALAAQSNSLNQILAKLPQGTPSDVITVSLRGTNVLPQAQGQLITDPKSESAVLVVTNLPPLEPGKTYQVWLGQDNKMVSVGLLKVDQNGQGVSIVTSDKAIGSFNALGISIEPEGGSPEPTGDIVVLSNL